MKRTENVKLSVMTWNIYLGAELTPLFAACSTEQIPEHVTEVYRQFLATNFLERAKTIADQINLKKPDIIGLQEAVVWKLISPDSHVVSYDFANILIRELRYRGLKYEVAAVNQNIQAALPGSTGNTIGLSDRDVILIRDREDLKAIKKKEANFKNNFQINISKQTFTALRGWSAFDVSFQGSVFRIINTHLDSDSPEVQIAQANELLDGPGKTELPLILIGDFNSNANDNETTYVNLITAGFKDSWIEAGKNKGFTCCQDSDLLNAESSLNKRIDLILLKNEKNWYVARAEVIGQSQLDRTKSRLWPSDHAGVFAKLKLKD
ncbi:endonuclease [Clostridium sp. P21]|uniref:Endonuclease n=1 Tax=Clostridium muellerianum TaxID=2716538 RepID=A0A7Y0EFF1_9CLOT|nr:endonuclease/exonuclease/phosphatase family protein [Clostridium muellerianum]NMM62480.1 endonuclease [Clostridium muellerianum]